MAAGKHYLKSSAFNGIPASIPIYRNADASQMSVNPADIAGGCFAEMLQVFHDANGHFIFVAADPVEIAGLSGLLQSA